MFGRSEAVAPNERCRTVVGEVGRRGAARPLPVVVESLAAVAVGGDDESISQNTRLPTD